jgi:hypothetical protein
MQSARGHMKKHLVGNLCALSLRIMQDTMTCGKRTSAATQMGGKTAERNERKPKNCRV